MEIVIGVLKWVFVDTIYGVVGIAAAIYGVVHFARRKAPWLPNPAYFAVPVFLIGILVLPTVGRYQFERDVASKIDGKGWIRVVNKTRWGSLTEPLTWINAPVGSVTFLMPNEPTIGGFKEVVMRYEKEPVVSLVSPDCSDSTISYSRPDAKGVFRYTQFNKTMTSQEKNWYCEYDWSKERAALRQELLSQMKHQQAK